MFRTFLLMSVLAIPCAAQPFSVGMKLGLPFGDAYDVVTSSNSIRDYFRGGGQFTVGPYAELKIPILPLSVEGDILYTRYNFSSDNIVSAIATGNSNAWEFPILVKYRFSGIGPIRPFIGAGPTFRRLQSVLRFDPRKQNDAGGTGVVFAGGLEAKILLLKIAPEVRYTHWGSQSFLDGANALIRAKQNQTQFLVGFGF
jgi:hypothetical protein